MDLSIKEIRKSQEGFTLVELAVVMIIIGLLIGGILKGQELITNARVTSTASQLEAMGAAYNGFRDKFNALPGDMSTARARIAACGVQVASCFDGTGDGVIGASVGVAGAVAANTAAGEPANFFGQLLAADFITGMDGTNTAVFGQAFPTAPIGGGFLVGDIRAGAPTGFAAGEMRPAPHVTISGTTAAVAVGTGVLTPQQAANIDRRLDDGLASSGSVIGQNTALACRTAAADDAYANDEDQVCVIGYRL
ncbi:MAG: prepilin-type N-terminal cleavage/methylation domain-containing protein [Alphaproteobacteria bacterium]|nr:prepilin-type N-terminal cleavage/methylation domain-containing protein [Alphaproteobacteria bacterium]